MDKIQQYSADLERIIQKTGSNKLVRVLSRPTKYLKGHGIKRLSQLNKKGYILKTKTFFDCPMQLLLPSGLDIYLYGAKTHDSEVRLTKFLINNLNSETIFFDVGAHFGYFSLLAAACNCASIYAFEASKNNFDLLQKNTAKINNIHLNYAAIYSSNGIIEFYEFPTLYAENNTTNMEQFKATSWISKNAPIQRKVNSFTLDSFIAHHQIIPSIVKIDVEGAELEVLKGLEDSLRKYPLTISLEYIFGSDGDSIYNKAYRYLIELGYEAHMIGQNGNLESIDDFNESKKELIHLSENLIFKPKRTV